MIDCLSIVFHRNASDGSKVAARCSDWTDRNAERVSRSYERHHNKDDSPDKPGNDESPPVPRCIQIVEPFRRNKIENDDDCDEENFLIILRSKASRKRARRTCRRMSHNSMPYHKPTKIVYLS